MTAMTTVTITRPTTACPPPTLGSRLQDRDNALNFVRLLLACCVILSHSLPIGGFNDAPWISSIFGPLGGWAVKGFFAVSGYLIVGSRLHTRPLGYLWRRALRIFPGYWTMLVIVAFVIAPASTLLEPGSHYHLSSGIQYVTGSALLYQPEWTISDTLVNIPLHAWNGSIWTLFYEFLAYLVVGALFSIPWARRHGKALTTTLLPLAVLAYPAMTGPLDVSTNLYLHSVQLGGFFLAGTCLYFWKEDVRCHVSLLLISSAAWVLLIYVIPNGVLIGQVPVALSTLLAGAVLPIRWGARNDLSYGIYIYGFPMQQIATLIGIASLGYGAHVLVSLVLTVPCAYLSWVAVERPALRLKRLVL